MAAISGGGMLLNTSYYWGMPARVLHWVTAALILFLFFHGKVAHELAEHGANRTQIYVHAAVGAGLASLMLLRFLWRLANKVPMLPAATPGWEKVMVHFAHIGLYVVTFSAIMSGWLLAGKLTPPLDVRVFGFIGVPTIDLGVPRKLFSEGHELLANLLIVMVVAHVAAALWHHFVKRDSVLRRMLLRGRNRQRT